MAIFEGKALSFALLCVTLSTGCDHAEPREESVETQKQGLKHTSNALITERIIASQDTRLVKAARNQNDGAAETLLIRGSGSDEHRPVIAFDLPDTVIKVDRATLVLTLRADMAPDGWVSESGPALGQGHSRAMGGGQRDGWERRDLELSN